MVTDIEDYFSKGCGRCDRFATPDCATRTWQEGLSALRRICRDMGLRETVKWGHPCYKHAGRNIAIIGALRGDFRKCLRKRDGPVRRLCGRYISCGDGQSSARSFLKVRKLPLRRVHSPSGFDACAQGRLVCRLRPHQNGWISSVVIGLEIYGRLRLKKQLLDLHRTMND